MSAEELRFEVTLSALTGCAADSTHLHMAGSHAALPVACCLQKEGRGLAWGRAEEQLFLRSVELPWQVWMIDICVHLHMTRTGDCVFLLGLLLHWTDSIQDSVFFKGAGRNCC